CGWQRGEVHGADRGQRQGLRRGSEPADRVRAAALTSPAAQAALGARVAGLRRTRTATRTPARPASVIAHASGSGAGDAMVTVPSAKVGPSSAANRLL